MRSSRLATRDDWGDANAILQQDLSALIDEGIKLMTIEQDPARCATNAEAGLPIALHGQTHNVQGAALQEAVHGVDADAQVTRPPHLDRAIAVPGRRKLMPLTNGATPARRGVPTTRGLSRSCLRVPSLAWHSPQRPVRRLCRRPNSLDHRDDFISQTFASMASASQFSSPIVAGADLAPLPLPRTPPRWQCPGSLR